MERALSASGGEYARQLQVADLAAVFNADFFLGAAYMGERVVPIRLQLCARPALALHNPADPAGIIIYATKGWSMARTLVLRETSGGAPIPDLRVLPQDLLDSANQQTLSSRQIGVDLATSQVQPGALLTATLRANLASVPAGAYKGNLTFVAPSAIVLTMLKQIAPEAEKFDELANEIAAQSQVLRQYMLDNPTHVKEQSARAAMATLESIASGEPGLFLPGISATDAFQPDKAQARLLQYAWLFYILSAIVLVALGMSTIYVPNPTFGANTLIDYFTLFVFGLGGQTTLASVTELLQKWGLPWGK